MAQNGVVDNRTSRDRQNNILNDSLPKKSPEQLDPEGAESSSDGENSEPECAVCLQPCIHPVQLPCSHIFCFLCVKGVANQSKRCALCRTEIPLDYLNNPRLLRKEDLLQSEPLEDGFQWYYEGSNGWWQYDVRTTQELEDRYKKGVKAFEILIAGFLYIVDMDSMIQFRRNDPTRRRRIKRDVDDIPNKKGVAGLKVARPEPVVAPESAGQEREGAGDGVEEEGDQSNGVPQTGAPTLPVVDSDSPPHAPTNTPQSPQDGSPGEPSSPTDLSSRMATLSLTSTRSARNSHLHRLTFDRPGHARQQILETPPSSSSDSDWD